MIFGTTFTLNKIASPFVKGGDTEIEIVNNSTNLGVMLDSKLSFSDHVTYLCENLFGHLEMRGKLVPS